MHPPTVYFPLLVDEALMEPTETEIPETLDVSPRDGDPEEEDAGIAHNAPYTTWFAVFVRSR
jgi:glycine dehydrogenase subunit 2